MPRRKAAVKTIRVAKKRNARNRIIKQKLRESVKSLRALVAAKKKDEALAALKKVSSLLDKAAKKNVIHARNADRSKSRLAVSISKIA